MRVLLFNGSPRPNGCTYTALNEIAVTLENEGVEAEILHIGQKPVRDCVACFKCKRQSNCVFSDDIVSEWIKKAAEADGFIFGTPVYFSHPTGAILSALDRMFFCRKDLFVNKPAAAVASARRGGNIASVDVLGKYFSISQMPVVSSTYWNIVYGMTPDEVKRDLEGMQTMRNLGRNMAWLLKCLDAGKASGVKLPEAESAFATNFIR